MDDMRRKCIERNWFFMICTKCGNETAGERFCDKCGANLIDGNEQFAPQPPVFQQPLQDSPALHDCTGPEPDLPQPAYEQQPPGYPQHPVYQQPPGYEMPPPGYPQQPAYQQPPGYQQSPGYQPQQPVYQPQPGFQQYPPFPHDTAMYRNGPDEFVERLHEFGGSAMFLIGIILFTLGSLFTILSSLSVASIITAPLSALPIIGFWMIFAASKSPRLPEKTLPALTMFKVVLVIRLVGMCLVILAMLIVAAAFMIGSSFFGPGYYNSGILIGVGVGLLIGMAVALVIAIVYFKAVFGVIKGIRNGIYRNIVSPLRGVTLFSVFAYIGAVSTIITSLTSSFVSAASTGWIDEMLNILPGEYQGFYGSLMGTLPNYNVLYMLFTLMLSVGTVLCVIVLGRFNNSLKYNR